MNQNNSTYTQNKPRGYRCPLCDWKVEPEGFPFPGYEGVAFVGHIKEQHTEYDKVAELAGWIAGAMDKLKL